MSFRPAFIRLRAFRRPRRKPMISVSRFALVPNGTLTITGQLPTSTCSVIPVIPSGSILLTGQAPTGRQDVIQTIPAGSLVLTPRTPTGRQDQIGLPGAGSLVITGRALTTRVLRVRRGTIITLRSQNIFDLDFARGVYELYGQQPTTPAGSSLWTFARASVGTAVDSLGVVTGFIAGQPRIADTGLVIEPAVTNQVLRSQALATAPWADIAAGVTTATNNNVTAPDGTLTGTRLVGNNANTWWTQDIGNGRAGLTQTLTGWLRAAAGYNATLVMSFNGGATYSQATAITTGWQRFAFTQAFGGGDVQNLRVGLNHGNGNTTYAWGFQHEASSLASTYVPTAAGAVARSIDAATIAAVPPPTFTLFADADLDNLDGVIRGLVSWDDGTANNIVSIQRYSDNNLRLLVFVGGGLVVNRGFAAKTGARRIKAAISYDGTNWHGACDGVAAADTAGAAPPGLTTVRVGASYGAGPNFPLQGRVRRIQAMNTALSTAAMQTLTT